MRRIALATLVVGTLDILDPIIFYALRGVKPIRILQSVASGLLGPSAFARGWTSAALGLALHFCIAFVVVLIYFAASRRLEILKQHPIVFGALYGLGVYTVMTFVVLPLSHARPTTFTWPTVLNMLFAHVFCVGIPTALFCGAGFSRRASNAHGLHSSA